MLFSLNKTLYFVEDHFTLITIFFVISALVGMTLISMNQSSEK